MFKISSFGKTLINNYTLEVFQLKKMIYAFIGFLLIGGLVACSDDPSVDNNPKEQVVPGDQETNTDTPDNIRKDDSENKSHEGEVQGDAPSADMMEELNFTEFDLEIKYGNNEFDFDYKQHDDNGSYKAELKDTVHEKNLKGVEAFNTIYNQFKDNPLDPNAPKEEVIQKILDIFQLSNDYTSFELEYVLRDGTKVDIEDKK